jgi:hypothetical protein
MYLIGLDLDNHLGLLIKYPYDRRFWGLECPVCVKKCPVRRSRFWEGLRGKFLWATQLGRGRDLLLTRFAVSFLFQVVMGEIFSVEYLS